MRRKSAAARVAYPAVLAALSLALVYLGSIAPRGNIGIVAAAGLLPAAAVISVGTGSGFLCWGAVSVLAFLLVPDKFCALMYAALFGLYPMVKSVVEGRRWPKPLEYAVKLAFFNAALTLLWLTMGAALLASLPGFMAKGWWILYLIGNIVFLLYDYGFSGLIALYVSRVDKHLR